MAIPTLGNLHTAHDKEDAVETPALGPAGDSSKLAARLKDWAENPPDEVIKVFREILEVFEEGMPPASSGEVLSHRARW